MTAGAIIAALALPEDARVEQRVPKKLLMEQGAPTAADKRAIQDGIEELFWVAALKPTNVGVPAFRDDVREYLEIAVLTATIRHGGKVGRLVELVHRAIPYPVVLISRGGAENAETASFSVAHKRWSQGEAGKVVIEDVQCTAAFAGDAPTPEEAGFLASLPVAGLPRGDLFALYQGWVDRVAALGAARITGAFAVPGATAQGEVLRDGLEAHKAMERELVQLRARAKKEKQINRRVELNLEIKRLEVEMAASRVQMKG
ncbi:MAG: DUF4391 domain-containing protein [Planctomycetes bacterium]|nr:DUF4391 domain-containing protein [Planctomycetota bacterium]